MFAALKKYLYPETEETRKQCIIVDEAMASLQETVKKNGEAVEILMRQPDPFRKLALRMRER